MQQIATIKFVFFDRATVKPVRKSPFINQPPAKSLIETESSAGATLVPCQVGAFLRTERIAANGKHCRKQ
jgi:hypothetical protein